MSLRVLATWAVSIALPALLTGCDVDQPHRKFDLCLTDDDCLTSSKGQLCLSGRCQGQACDELGASCLPDSCATEPEAESCQFERLCVSFEDKLICEGTYCSSPCHQNDCRHVEGIKLSFCTPPQDNDGT